MRIESSVTSISWIPSGAVKGAMKLPLDMGMAHYDKAPPEVLEGLEDLEELRRNDRFRFANVLKAWIDVEDGRITGYGQDDLGMIGSTTVRLGRKEMTILAVSLPTLRPEPELRAGAVRFVQTAGGRTGVPVPRRVNHPPFVQIAAPLAWTTLALTIHTDGRSEIEVAGASPFPRHWIYDHEGKLAQKTGLIDFKTWFREAFGKHSPWGDEDARALVSEVETALERELSNAIMRGSAKPKKRKIAAGKIVVEQGERGTDVFLLLDGVVSAEVDGTVLAEIGPGAVLGERAVIEGGVRTATLRAVTPCKVAVVPGDALDPEALAELSKGHRREEQDV